MYLFLCPLYISALIHNKVLRTHLLTLVNKSNNNNNNTKFDSFFYRPIEWVH